MGIQLLSNRRDRADAVAAVHQKDSRQIGVHLQFFAQDRLGWLRRGKSRAHRQPKLAHLRRLQAK